MGKLSGIFVTVLATSCVLAPMFANAADEVSATADAYSNGADDPGLSAPSPWPIQVTANGRTFLIYQPQVDKWQDNRFEGRSAVSVRDETSGRQNFGVIYFSARTELDPGSRTVTVRDAVVSKADFPALRAGVDEYLAVLRPQFAALSWRIAQDRLQSDMEIDKLARQSAQQPLRNDPPRIVFSERPAVLVPIDGNPVLRAVGDTGLKRVTNTRALMIWDAAASRYYLFVSDHWMESRRLEGPWSVATNPPSQLEQAKQLALQEDQVDLLNADAADGAVMPASVSIFVSTTPTELLQTDGPAQYAPIERTQLLYVTNSPNKLFLDLKTQNHYALISGRWYRTTSLSSGQWSYVPAVNLPSDFAMIPAEHPAESVRAAVPGTPQAREAVIANSVPQMATVERSAVTLDVAYDGSPVFQPIEGTALQYAVNSPVPVIRVSEESFYALDNGVWFVASSPFGPWAVASYVPPVVYSIPPSSPLYYVTYVRVYDATPQVVYVGYTPGYIGSYVSADSVVVYGTGWPYSPWIGSVWYGAPVTWGFGFSFVYSWWHPYPWYAWHRAAWAPAPPCFRPWWGPWHAPVYAHGPTGRFAGGRNAMRPAGPGWHNVGHIYERWDRRSVAWNAPAQLRRPAARDYSYPAPGSGFVTGPDGRRRRVGNDGERVRHDMQARDRIVNSQTGQTPRAMRPLPPIQNPWRDQPQAGNRADRGSAQSVQPRIQSPSVGGGRMPADNRRLAPRERVFDQQLANEAAPRSRVDGRGMIEPPRVIMYPQRPLQSNPQPQYPQRLRAGVPIERTAPAPRMATPAARPFTPPSNLPGRATLTGPVHIERPVVANPARAVAQPSVNSERVVTRGAERLQLRGSDGPGWSNFGDGQGRWRGGGNHR